MRAFVDLWDEIAGDRYGVADPKLRRFRYGVQVNSLGLTEQQPENNVYRILIEMLAVVLSKKARARAVQLPAWNEALGLPRPWDQQWSLRMQQIMAYETDLLEYGDLFDGNPAVETKVEALKAGARAELAKIDEMGGAVAAIDYMKSRARRRQHRAARRGSRPARPSSSGSTASPRPSRRRSPPATAASWSSTRRVEAEQVGAAAAPGARAATPRRSRRRSAALRAAAAAGENVMPASIAAAKAGVTTGEWGRVMREVFGEYRAPTGVGKAAARAGGGPRRGAGGGRGGRARGSGGGSSSSSASRGSTAIRTAPSRSRSARATAAWRWSTRASG